MIDRPESAFFPPERAAGGHRFVLEAHCEDKKFIGTVWRTEIHVCQMMWQ